MAIAINSAWTTQPRSPVAGGKSLLMGPEQISDTERLELPEYLGSTLGLVKNWPNDRTTKRAV